MLASIEENSKAIWKNPKLITGAMEAGFDLLSDLVNIHTSQIKMQIKSRKYPMVFSTPLI